MAIKLKYEELLQDDDLSDDLMKNTKDTIKKDFDSLQCKCELLEEGGDEDDGEISWNEIAKRFLMFLVTLSVVIFVSVCFFFLATSVYSLVRGGNDLGQGRYDLLVRQEDDLMTRSLEDEELRQLGRLDLLRMEMEEIGNKEMAAEFRDKSYWFKLKMETLDEFLKKAGHRKDE